MSHFGSRWARVDPTHAQLLPKSRANDGKKNDRGAEQRVGPRWRRYRPGPTVSRGWSALRRRLLPVASSPKPPDRRPARRPCEARPRSRSEPPSIGFVIRPVRHSGSGKLFRLHYESHPEHRLGPQKPRLGRVHSPAVLQEAAFLGLRMELQKELPMDL